MKTVCKMKAQQNEREMPYADAHGITSETSPPLVDFSMPEPTAKSNRNHSENTAVKIAYQMTVPDPPASLIHRDLPKRGVEGGAGVLPNDRPIVGVSGRLQFFQAGARLLDQSRVRNPRHTGNT